MGPGDRMKRAWDKAHAYNKSLTADNPGFRFTTRVVHEEGSIFFVESAFPLKWVDPDGLIWIFVFAEHQTTLVFADEEVKVQVYGQRQRVEPLEG